MEKDKNEFYRLFTKYMLKDEWKKSIKEHHKD